MLIVRIAIAVGLALLLVVGAWSTSHGSADVHATLCLAPGVSPSAGSGASETEDAVAVEESTGDAALCVAAVLCCATLVLLLRRLRGGLSRPIGGRAPRASLALRAGPARPVVPALTLTQLSLSRT